MDVGAQIRKARLAKGLSQAELGKRVRSDGRSISNYERGVSLPSAEAVVRLAEVLGVSCDYLLRGDGEVGGEADPELRELLRDAQALSPTDRDVIKEVIRAVVVRRRVEAIKT